MATKQVAALAVGDKVPCVRTIVSVTSVATSVAVVFDDGTSQSWDLSGDPSVEVVGG